MSAFTPEEFMVEPTYENILKLRKDDLKALGKYLKVELKSSMSKREIQHVILKRLCNDKLVDEENLSIFMQNTRGEVDSIAQTDVSQEESDERQWQREEEEIRWRRERERLEWERECAREERAFKLREQEIELEKLKLQATNKHADHSKTNFDITKHVRMVPPFPESEVDKYFLHFEKVAENCKWPKESWTMLLQSVLIGKAREIFSQMSVIDSADYDLVKDAILKGYELVPEAYRQKFRAISKNISITHLEFAEQKAQLFDRWLASEKVQDFKTLRQLILMEEFKNCIHSETRIFLNEQNPKTLSEAARLADNFSLTHKFAVKTNPHPFSQRNTQNTLDGKQTHSSRFSSRFPNNYAQGRQNLQGNGSQTKQNFQSMQYQGKQYSPGNSAFRQVICDYCKRKGHTKSECYLLKSNRPPPKPTGILSRSDKNIRNTNKSVHKITRKNAQENPNKALQHETLHHNITTTKHKDFSDSDMETFKPFIHDGNVTINSNRQPVYVPIKILRDTGASQSVILGNTLPFSEQSYSGKNVLIRGISSTEYESIPLHNIKLQSDLIKGDVVIGVINTLPFAGIHLLLGNDLAGEKVQAGPVLSNKPVFTQQSNLTEQVIPDLYPSCAITRALKKRQDESLKNTENNDIQIENTFLHDIFENQKPSKLSFIEQGSISKSDLIEKQQNDPNISTLYHKASEEADVKSDPVCYYIRNGVLMRKWRPPHTSVNDEWAYRYQIVAPQAYHHDILSLAHETPLSGHLGINKTYNKIITHFYWPGLRKDVAEFCKTCHVCQVVGKPNQTIPKAPLQPIPAFEEPFSRVLIDCVGPLPKTKKGNEYLLTIMCASTRFPEAIPLRNIRAKTIVQALTKFFTLVGLPKSIQSDQGSNFMSGLFQQVMHELNITQFKSSAYHPESQGALERFHQTLKNMIRMYCQDKEKDWDEGVHFLLFAARDSVQESLGFTPFELVFGHTVRGPLKLLKEKLLTEENNPTNLLTYVSDFRNKLTTACEIARTNLESAQNCMKEKYDKNSITRNFKVGDKVLALLKIPGTPLQARYYGPYVIEKKVSDLNYVIITPDRRKKNQLCHVNMLKPYFDRKRERKENVGSVVSNISEEELPSLTDTASKLSNSEILKNIPSKLTHLNPTQKKLK